jgi:hypothetical protein
MAVLFFWGSVPNALPAQGRRAPHPDQETTTPIKHLVV